MGITHMNNNALRQSVSNFILTGLLVIHWIPVDCINAQGRNVNNEPRITPSRKNIKQLLVKGQVIDDKLAKGEVHTFGVQAVLGQYLKLIVEHQGFDVTVTILDPNKSEIAKIDSANLMRGPELVELVTEASGLFTVKIQAAQYGSAGGRYQARIIHLRDSTKDERTLNEARKLQAKSTELKENGQYSEAIKTAEQALSNREEVLGNQHGRVALTLNHLGEILVNKGEFTRAEEVYKRARKVFEEALDPVNTDLAKSLNGLGLIYYLTGKFAEAEPLLQRALTIWEHAVGPQNPNVAEPLDSIGGIFEAKGDFENAEATYRRALTLRENGLEPTHPAIAASLNNLALLYVRNGLYSKAEPLFSRALDIMEAVKGKTHPEVAFVLNNQGILHRIKGNYGEAERLYRRVIDIREKEPGRRHPDYAVSLNNLAMVYNWKGDYDKAEPLFQDALSILESQTNKNIPSISAILNNLGVLYMSKGNYEKAEQIYQRVLKLQPALATYLNNLSLLYMTSGDFGKAEPFLDNAKTIVAKIPNQEHPEVARTNNLLGLFYYSKGKYTEAEPFLDTALSIRKKVFGDKHPDVASTLSNLAFLYEAKGELTRAIDARTRGGNISEAHIDLNLTTGSQRQKLLFMDTLSSETNAIVSLHVQSAPTDSKALNLAFTTILRRKGRALEAMTDSIAVLRKMLDPKKRKLIDDLTDARSHLSFLFLRGLGRMSPQQYQQEINKLEAHIEDLESEIGNQSSAFRVQNQSVTLESVQAAMPSNSALVEFVRYKPLNVKATTVQDRVGPARYAAYVLPSKGKPLWTDLRDAQTVDDAIESLRRALRDTNNRETVKTIARTVDEIVMSPVRKLLGGSKLILLSPDGALNLVPFGALLDEHNSFLIENYSFVYLTTGRDLLRWKVQVTSKRPPVIFANPDFGPALGKGEGEKRYNRFCSYLPVTDLEGTAKQAKSLKNLLPGAVLLPRRRATETAIKKVEGPSILHVATHGFFLTCPEAVSQAAVVGAPDILGGAYRAEDRLRVFEPPSAELETALLRSGLALTDANLQKSGSDDGILTAIEASSLNLWGTKLVVLSACDTGIGDVKSGEGVYGLRRALVLAGSESQVISLWKVADIGTRDLMVAYYRGLMAGRSRNDALRDVQRCMIKSDDRWHPFYWAAFIQSGNWGSIKDNSAQKPIDCDSLLK
jgi:CHAT domain-containing protein/Flp pilus assembly protein TadD